MRPWYHGTWYHGNMVPWYCSTMVPWYHDTVVPWYHGTMVPWYHGTMVPWHHGTMVPLHHGTMVPWYQRLRRFSAQAHGFTLLKMRLCCLMFSKVGMCQNRCKRGFPGFAEKCRKNVLGVTSGGRRQNVQKMSKKCPGMALKCQKMSGGHFFDILPKPSWTPAGPQDIFLTFFGHFVGDPQK